MTTPPFVYGCGLVLRLLNQAKCTCKDVVCVCQDHLLKMEQQASALAQLTNQRASLLSHDICSKYQPAHDLDEQVNCLYMEIHVASKLALRKQEEKKGKVTFVFVLAVVR